jgi:copper(I)-binding protein
MEDAMKRKGSAMRKMAHWALALALAAGVAAAQDAHHHGASGGSGPIDVKGAWIRGIVPGQKATGAFMDITSTVSARLVGAASPAAGTVEIHNMKMESGVMKMFAVDGVDLPPGRAVKLAPGGYHVMMFDLKQTLKPGDRVPLRLTFELEDRKRHTVEVQAEVRTLSGARHAH